MLRKSKETTKMKKSIIEFFFILGSRVVSAVFWVVCAVKKINYLKLCKYTHSPTHPISVEKKRWKQLINHLCSIHNDKVFLIKESSQLSKTSTQKRFRTALRWRGCYPEGNNVTSQSAPHQIQGPNFTHRVPARLPSPQVGRQAIPVHASTVERTVPQRHRDIEGGSALASSVPPKRTLSFCNLRCVFHEAVQLGPGGAFRPDVFE